MNSDWRVRARCRTEDAKAMFRPGAHQRLAKVFCTGCPVRTECLAHALDQRIEDGVWGGTTERERRAMLAARPDVPSWAELLAAARADYETSQRSLSVTNEPCERGSEAG